MWTKLLKSTCFPVPAKDTVYIEADAETAEKVFANRYGFSPYEEKCACCGMAYIPHEGYETLREATMDERGAEPFPEDHFDEFAEQPARRFDGSLCDYQTFNEYLGEPGITFIYEQEISESDLEDFDTNWEFEGDQNFYDLDEGWDEHE